MRFTIPLLAFLVLALGSAQAEARSCSSFATIQKYDGEGSRVKLKFKKGRVHKYFPRPDGSPTELKVPRSCSGRVVRKTVVGVNATGGRLSVTQVRTNFEGRMMNDTEDPAWLGNVIEKLIADKTQVVAVIKPGVKDDDPNTLTTIYMPISDEERAEIQRIDDQAIDIEE